MSELKFRKYFELHGQETLGKVQGTIMLFSLCFSPAFFTSCSWVFFFLSIRTNKWLGIHPSLLVSQAY